VNIITWKHKEGDYYLITGKTTDGRKFRLTYPTWYMASGINLYNGHKWLVRGNKRILLETVSN